MDGRAFLLRPTEDGQARLTDATSARRDEWRQRLDGWSAADLTDFAAALERLNTDLDAL
jgi:DNA-binding MarR family transcriptional regulator